MKWLLVILAAFTGARLQAQDTTFKPITIPDIKLTDTIFEGYTLQPTIVYSWKTPKDVTLSSRDQAYLRKVYPYALRIGHLVDQIEREMATMSKNKQKKRYVSEMEKMLKDQFTDDVKDLTRIQGQMLTKLIHRETNRTVYELIKGYKSGFSAGWWNLLGKFYDQDLKMEYDPNGADAQMEKYVRYLDLIYQRNGLKESIKNEQFVPPVQDKKRKRKRD